MATTAGVNAVPGLLLTSLFDTYAGATADEHLITWLRASTSAESIRACIRGGEWTLLTALDRRGRVVGTGRINDLGYISHIAAATPRSGIGGAVLGALLTRAKAMPWMSVWTGNAGTLALGSSRGFAPMPTDPDERYLPDLRFQIPHRVDGQTHVVCLEYGTTVGGFLPGSWDHLTSQLWDHTASFADGFSGQLFDHRVSVFRRGGHRLWDSGRSV